MKISSEITYQKIIHDINNISLLNIYKFNIEILFLILICCFNINYSNKDLFFY